MRILLLNRHYGDEHVPTGRMLADVAVELVERGHETVTVSAKSSYAKTVGAVRNHAGGSIRLLWLIFPLEKPTIVA